MDKRKTEKTAVLALVGLVLALAVLTKPDFQRVGIYAGCGVLSRLAYPFFHAGFLHAALNAWCLLCIMFVYDVSWRMLLLAYAVAVSVPVGWLGCTAPTVGLSGVVFFLFGSLSFSVVRKWYYQAWMLTFLAAGFINPHTNGRLHLYCYAIGFTVALLNCPYRKGGGNG